MSAFLSLPKRNRSCQRPGSLCTCSAHSVLKGLGYVDVLDCVFSANARELIFSSLSFLPSPASVFSS